MAIQPNQVVVQFSRSVGEHQRGWITDDEFINKVSDVFADDRELRTDDAAEIVQLCSPRIVELLRKRVSIVLEPGYLRQAFHLGGSTRTDEEIRAAARRETASEVAWAEALNRLLAK